MKPVILQPILYRKPVRGGLLLSNRSNFSSGMHLLLKKIDMNKNKKNIKNVTRCRDSKSAKSIETR